MRKKSHVIFCIVAVLTALAVSIALTVVYWTAKTISPPSSAQLSALAEYLNGKKVSVLGDSISTYEGYSDNPNYNSTLSPTANFSFYTANNGVLSSANESWWLSTVNDLSLNLLVNNSCGGLCINLSDSHIGTPFDGVVKSDNLHCDIGDLNGACPDIVFVYLGTNDVLLNNEVGTFEDVNLEQLFVKDGEQYVYAKPKNVVEAYSIILHKIATLYNNPDVFCLNVLQNGQTSVNNINGEIAKVANHFGATLVDISNQSGINKKTLDKFTSDTIHPNKAGMKLISYTLEHAMIDKYL